MWFNVFGCALLLIIVKTTTTFGEEEGETTENVEKCTWSSSSDNKDLLQGKIIVSCNFRTLDGSGTNLSALPVEGTVKLRLQCSDSIFFDSELPSEGLRRLQELQEIQITKCKLLSLEDDSLKNLYNLRKLVINSFNVEWSNSKSLELKEKSFVGLKELQLLDLGYNNIRTIPEEVFCQLPNLHSLNLTRNKLKSAEKLGFGNEFPSINTNNGRNKGCSNSDLQILDLSYNEIVSLPENSGLSRLRRLQTLDLKFNNISEVSGEALNGLVSLRILNLANNEIGSLPQGLFAGSRELREVHLQNNSLFSLAKGLFHRLEQLLVLDLSGNQLTSSHIDAGTFTGLIRLIVLNLSHNALTRIDGRTFKDLYFLQILDLRNNSIGFIENNAFLPLYNLHTLNLAENRLNTIGPFLFNGLFVLSKLTLNNNLILNIDPKAFRNCSDLKELDLSSNVLEEVPEAVQELSFLKTLDLGENQISDFHNGSFKNLNQLTGLRLIDNNIGNLTKGMLWDLPSLQVLNLAKNKVQNIERGTFDRNTQIEAIRLDENFLSDINGVFATLASLLWLNLSKNHLVWFDYAFIPSNLKWLDIHGNFIEHLANYYKIQDEIRVKTLDASHNRIASISPMSIPNSIELLFINNNFIKNILPNTFAEKANLIRVDMYANDLEKLDLSSLRLSPIPANRSLPEVYIGGNTFQCDCSMEWLQLINNMSNMRQYPRIMDLENVMCRMSYSRAMSHVPLLAAKPTDFLCSYETHCFTLCKCCDYDACDCEMTCPQNCSCYHDQTWNTNVVDCSNLRVLKIPQRIPMDATELYLDGNNFTELQDHVFIGRQKMEVLYVNNSGVVSIQNQTFNGLKNLKILHLEDNRLRELKGFEFEKLSQLEELYLQNNMIGTVGNMTFSSLESLQIIRLDGNKLVSFPVWQFGINKQLNDIFLGGNQWSCRCKFLQEFSLWVNDNVEIVRDASLITCLNVDSNPPQIREIKLNDSAVCSDYYAVGSVIDSMFVSDYLPMAVVSLCIVLLIVLGVILWFSFRDSARVWLYSRYGVRLCSFRAAAAKSCEDRDKLYDCFVCYSPKDEEWVVQSLSAELEPTFQLCLHYRDVPHAAYVQHAAPAVLEAAEASKRVILVLTRNFLQTEWSRYELRQALHEALKGRVFKLIILEEGPLPEAELDIELKPYLKTGHRIRWDDRRFYEKLRYAMPSVEARGKINANYRRNINNYTIDSSRVVVANGAHHHHHHHHHHNTYPEIIKNPAPPSPGLGLQMFPPPAYSAGIAQEVDDANYSSATTATPSPKPTRRMQQQDPRPLSDHIYSSIDSDYSTLERGGSNNTRRGPPWRPKVMMQHHAVGGSGGSGQAYLV